MSQPSRELEHLDREGYLLLDDFMPGDFLREVRRRIEELFLEEGERAGAEFRQEPGCRRLANVVDKGQIFQTLIAEPRVLDLVRHVLGPEIKLSSLNARLAPSGAGGQPLHVDMAALPDEHGYWVCNTVWMLDDFTPDNGTIRLIPGSHLWRQDPRAVLPDLSADDPRQILITGKAGSVMVMNAHVWHSGTVNRTTSNRTAVHAFYCRRDKPQQQYQKRLLRLEVQQGLSAELRWLLALDDPRNDMLSQDVAVRSGFLK